MATLEQTRSSADEAAVCAFVLAIEGIGTMWVTDHPGDVLRGSGASSWVGQYEVANPTWETVGSRSVIGGLRLPSTLPKGRLNPNTGLLESTQVTFDLVDLDGVLASLWASEEEQPEELAERIAPGTDPLDPTLQIRGLASLDPADKHIGIERIGPGRERRWHWAFPWQGLGLHHQQHPDAAADGTDGPQPVPITDSPQIFAGRVVSLWRLYRDPQGDGSSYTSWLHWGEQYEAGALEWWGVMQDRGEYQGDQTWRVQCWGPESLLRRRLGTVDTGGWFQVVSGGGAPPEEQRGIAVSLKHRDAAGSLTTYDSGFFDTLAEADYDSADDLAAAISTFVQKFADGSESDFGGATDFNAAGGSVRVTRDEIGVTGDPNFPGGEGEGRYFMSLCVHEQTWRRLGWEIETQLVELSDTPLESFYQVYGQRLDAGDKFTPGGTDEGLLAPGEGYIVLHFVSTSLGVSAFGVDGLTDSQMSNDGAERIYRPKFDLGDPIILSASGGFDFEILGEFPYVEGDPTVIQGTHDHARYWLFKGPRSLLARNDQGELEPVTEDEFQVAEVRWNESGSNYGTIDVPDAHARLHLESWAMPRAFQIDRARIGGDWAFTGDDAVFCRPLHGFNYAIAGDPIEPFERPWVVLTQLLLSTGTWDGDPFAPGAAGNAPPASGVAWATDVLGSEMGLGIPYQLVQPAGDMQAEFATLFDGTDDGVNECRYVYGEPFDSSRLIESIVSARGLAITLRGGRYSITNFTEFDEAEADADLVVDEGAIHGEIDDPRSVVPTQMLRATGPIDQITIEAGRDPATGDPNVERTWSARDAGARFRRGDVEQVVFDDGLVPESFKYQNGSGNQLAGPWEDKYRQRWAEDLAAWRARRHFVVETKLHRISGQDVWPGTRVLYSNPWVYNPAGGLGVTNAVGVVLDVTWSPNSETYAVSILVFAGQFGETRFFSPIGKIASGWTGDSTVPLVADADFLAHGGAGDPADDFDEPPTGTVLGGGAVVCVLEHDSARWTLHSADTQTVASTNGTTVTLDGPFSTSFHAYSDKYLVFAEMSAQSDWPTGKCLPVVLDDHTFDGDPGYPFENF